MGRWTSKQQVKRNDRARFLECIHLLGEPIRMQGLDRLIRDRLRSHAVVAENERSSTRRGGPQQSAAENGLAAEHHRRCGLNGLFESRLHAADRSKVYANGMFVALSRSTFGGSRCFEGLPLIEPVG